MLPCDHPESMQPPCELVPASAYTVEALTDAYNQTRVDYIVPMPMNPARLQAYIDDYGVDLDRSVVARDGADILGLAMLGRRSRRTWITRLGVLPIRRRGGTGEAMMRYLIAQSRDLGADDIILEVIKDNEPAHQLFLKLGFVETRELLILRRPPGAPRESAPPYKVSHGDHDAALALLEKRRSVPSWLDDLPTMQRTANLNCLEVTLSDGSSGWLTYQSEVFQLGRLVVQAEDGEPAQVARALAHALHTQHPIQDTKTENFPAADPHLPGLIAMRYLESFRRIEMRLALGV
ncbi:MAG: GNAT family N-acetyltransferase [Anaerolineae bacterium]|nr:GNAT family N-acetyltransferase [Anaerolineae bacterium]